ncbi:hypothetical protein ACN23B_27825 (plasmid) [Anabaena sp. FACHB-709]|nr:MULTISPECIES: hypothetical protein [Nostocaceae]
MADFCGQLFWLLCEVTVGEKTNERSPLASLRLTVRLAGVAHFTL